MEQLTKNQAVATSQEAVQNQNEPQLRDENAHNDNSVHGVLNPSYQAGFFFFNDTATTEIYTLSLHDALPISCQVLVSDFDPQDAAPLRRALDQNKIERSEEHTSELQSRLHLVCRLLLEKKKTHAAPSQGRSLRAPNRTPARSHHSMSAADPH